MEADDLLLYFAIAAGVVAGVLLLLFVLVCVLFVKVNRLSKNGLNQLHKQTMIADYCYTNPTIVPGELLSRRGFSMYSGSDNIDDDYRTKRDHSGSYLEARSKF
ncbi:hypothetical protein QLX08_003903 [Tetragonisca angustula]|uniref:Uncharacterized protein n=1 Tax=Tetragonisca angustula TaxID=166442 RepID=A0AAW1A529_9HYME|nr:uncharacterized protein LOC122534347 [Frieseomelitta varia]